MGKDIAIVIIVLVGLFIVAIYFGSGEFSFSGALGNGSDPYLSPRFKVSEPRELFLSSFGRRFSGQRTSDETRQGETRESSGGFDRILRTAFERSLLRGKSVRDTGRSETISEAPPKGVSLYQGRVFITAGRSKEIDPAREFITVSFASRSEGEDTNLTGWKIKTSRGEEFKIGEGARLPYSSAINPQSDIILKRGERANIITGRSPIGTSFATNICAGYFNQFQQFHPSLRTSCPHPSDEPKIASAGLNDTCLNYIERLSACQIPLSQKPFNLNSECLNYIEENVNYNGCVDAHKSDADFYTGTWFVYLNRDREIYKSSREIISLYDKSGLLIQSISY